jgi:PilZ domain-containing protein
MKPHTIPYERRRFKRCDMVTRDCSLTLMRVRAGRRERETCILVDLSYAGLRCRAFRPVEEGELIEFLVNLGPPSHRSGSVQARVRWVRVLSSHEYDCGVLFLEGSKGLLEPDEESV